MSHSIARTMIASRRDAIVETQILRDELPALQADEIRLRVDKVGLSANNLFYAQMGEAPFLKFFSVYPLPGQYDDLAILPTWGVATIIESANPAFSVGEQYRGFLHITDVVQMKARRNATGFAAYGDQRDKINPAYNEFKRIDDAPGNPLRGTGEIADFALVASPGAVSGFILSELLKRNDFYEAPVVVLTSASSKLSLATAVQLRASIDSGHLEHVIGYTSQANRAFVEQTGVFDSVLTMDQALPDRGEAQYVFIDVAGDAQVFKQNKSVIKKALAVGGTHSDAKASTFTAFGPSGFLKMFIDMVAPAAIKRWGERSLSPKLEMFFAPTVVQQLVSAWGQEAFDSKADAALAQFARKAVEEKWIEVRRSENEPAIQAAYQHVMSGEVAPATAVILSLANAG